MVSIICLALDHERPRICYNRCGIDGSGDRSGIEDNRNNPLCGRVIELPTSAGRLTGGLCADIFAITLLTQGFLVAGGRVMPDFSVQTPARLVFRSFRLTMQAVCDWCARLDFGAGWARLDQPCEIISDRNRKGHGSILSQKANGIAGRSSESGFSMHFVGLLPKFGALKLFAEPSGIWSRFQCY